jgi:hypothetical protein
VQTTYLGAMLQYRIPFMKKADLTAAFEGGTASAGVIVGGELGIHYDATADVGVSGGLRVTHLGYNLDAQQKAIIAQGVSSLGVLPAATTTQPSYNVEASMGIYFHF